MCKWNSKARRLTGTNFEDLKKSDVSQMLKDLMRHLRSFSNLLHSHETLFNNCFTNSVQQLDSLSLHATPNFFVEK